MSIFTVFIVPAVVLLAVKAEHLVCDLVDSQPVWKHRCCAKY